MKKQRESRFKKKGSAGEVTKLILKDNSEISCKELNPLINPHKG